MHIKSAIRAKYMLDSSEKCKELASSALLLRSRLKKAQICPHGNPLRLCPRLSSIFSASSAKRHIPVIANIITIIMHMQFSTQRVSVMFGFPYRYELGVFK